jgi:hypothetical protein
MQKTVRLIEFLLLPILVVGCSGGPKDDGTPPAFKEQATAAVTAAKNTNGDYDKMTPDQKKQFLDMANGNEKMARNMAMHMASPPQPKTVGAAPPGASK